MHHPIRALFFCCIALLVTMARGQSVRENNVQWTAKELWPDATSQGVILEKGSIILNDQHLIEDDAPGCGFDSNPASIEVLKGGVVLKKILIVDRLPVKEACIVALLYPKFPPNPNNGRHVVFNVNGYETSYEVNHFWTKASIPASVLKLGENIVTLRTLEPDAQFTTWLAMDENYSKGSSTRMHAPGRSSRSNDGGKTWTDRIGELGRAKGEYVIRLKIGAYGSEGHFESPVVDLGRESQDKVLNRETVIHTITIDAGITHPKGTTSEQYVRSGSTLSPDDTHWSLWTPVRGMVSEKLIKGRFIQVRIVLKSDDPLKSPTFTSLRVTAAAGYPVIDPRDDYRVIAFRHDPLRNSSFPFEYENPHHPRVQRLREKFHLDSIVSGAKTEFEKILRLKHWIAQQWQWHLLRPNEDMYDWDAEKILTPDSSGKIYGGFCLHYAVTLMQVLQTFGFQSRVVSADYSVWSGHEICEVWSNEFGKWVMLDANFDTYFIDRLTGIPMNALELHDVFVKEFFPNSKIDRDAWSRERLAAQAKKHAMRLPVIGMTGGGANSGSLKQYEWWNPPVDQTPYCGGYGPLTMGYLRFLPRANYLSKPDPLPVNHGRTHWGWTGYYDWYDSHTPRAQEHELFSNRVNDLYWNLNQVGMHVTAQSNGMLDVQLETHSPDLECYEITLNGDVARVKENEFKLQSRPGMNRMEIRTLDSMGNKGMKSFLEYLYAPSQEQSIP